ncbi:MAG: hypothetical protein EG826_10260 [Deltaproteobacteria bacterium]|nr:hypothetical protein [Deltaproteobacteria bacterium]
MNKYFKTVCLFSCMGLMALIACLSPRAGSATPPESIGLKYTLATQTLSVTVTHDTMLKGSHHIKYIEIKKNGAVVSINTYTEQPTGKTFTYQYTIPAIEEDTFQVKATCNMWGNKSSAVLTVTK